MTDTSAGHPINMESSTPDTSPKREILVLGAGVIGLTTAIRLCEAGHSVFVLAAETPTTILSRATSPLSSTPPSTYTSSGSGGFWMPFLLSGSAIERWATRTYEILSRASEQDVGVDLLDGYLLQASTDTPALPWYAELTHMQTRTPRDDARIPTSYRSALYFRAPIAHMERYLPHLEQRARSLGVGVELTVAHTAAGEGLTWTAGQVRRFLRARYSEARPVVVNCCGLGARSLAQDEVLAVRGVTVRVKRPGDVRYFITEDPSDGLVSVDGMLAYCLPRGEEYTLGGTILRGDERETATADEVEGVVARAESILPGIAGAERVGVWAGLRPVRADGRARVEVQEEGIGEDGVTVVANYGHGGSGVTICWGCAEEVVRIVDGLAKG